MMKISCNVIRDLLPLYAENMASQDSRELVDEHLCECEPCREVLNEMKKETSLAGEISVEPLSKVKNMIVRRRALSVMAAVLSMLTLASFVITFLFAPFQLTKEQALDDFYVREDGTVVIDYSPYAMGRHLSGRVENWIIHQYSTRYDMWKANNRESIEALYGTDGVITEEERQRYENIDIVYGTWYSEKEKVKSDAPIPWAEDAVQVSGGSDWNWWYADPTGLGHDTLLHDAGKGYTQRYTFSPVYPLLFFGGVVATVIFWLLRKVKKNVLQEAASRLCILSGSLAFSVLFTSSGRIFTSDVGVIDQYWGWMIGMNTVLLTLTALFWRQLHLLNQQDKAI